jgi:hypothetical protein
MKRLLLCMLPLLAALPARAQAVRAGPGVAATPRPVLCPGLSGLEIGQRRAAAYESMWCRNAQKPALGKDLTILYTPREHRYTVTVTFDAETPDARVAALHYVFDPAPGLLGSIRERYGPETPGSRDGADPSLHVWDVPSCGVRIRYRVQLTETKRPLVEELWIDRLPGTPEKAPEKAAEKKTR